MHHAEIEIRPFMTQHAAAWEAYVAAAPQATVFHRLAWSDAVAAAYGHEPMHLTAIRNGEIVGVLPMMLVKSRFVGTVLVSVPYATYGGIAGDDEQVVAALLAAAEQRCVTCEAEYLELRHREARPVNLPAVTRYDTFRQVLPDDSAAILPAIPKKARAACRQGLKACDTQIGRAHLDTIYDLYSITMRRLGSPNFSRRLFHELADRYHDNCVCLIVTHENQPVAGVVSFVFRDELMAYFSGSLPEAKRLSASNVMYLRLMEYAVEQGLRVFDFNRTRRDNPGPHAFKRHMGFTPQTMCYQMLLHNAQELPNLSPSNRKFAAAGRLWKKMPLWFTRPVGAKLTQWIP